MRAQLRPGPIRLPRQRTSPTRSGTRQLGTLSETFGTSPHTKAETQSETAHASTTVTILDEENHDDGTTDGGTIQELAARWARGVFSRRKSRRCDDPSG